MAVRKGVVPTNLKASGGYSHPQEAVAVFFKDMMIAGNWEKHPSCDDFHIVSFFTLGDIILTKEMAKAIYGEESLLDIETTPAMLLGRRTVVETIDGVRVDMRFSETGKLTLFEWDSPIVKIGFCHDLKTAKVENGLGRTDYRHAVIGVLHRDDGPAVSYGTREEYWNMGERYFPTYERTN